MQFTICGVPISSESALGIATNLMNTCLQRKQDAEFRYGRDHYRTKIEERDYIKAVKLVNRIKRG